MTPSDLPKQEWMDMYACRMLDVWQRWQSPLGVDSQYAEKLKEDLGEFYDDPLKKSLIEATY